MSQLKSSHWYAVRVRSRCEKLAASSLLARDFEVFPALMAQRRVWVDRVRTVEMPLFPGYIFARFASSCLREVERTSGVAAVVRFGEECCPVDDAEIAALRRVVDSGLAVQRAPFLRVGRSVMVKYGPLAGVRGLVLEIKNRYRIVVSVALLQRAVAMDIDEAMLEPLWSPTSELPPVWAPVG